MEVSESAATDPPEITLPAARQAGARALKATLVLRVLATIARLGFAGAAAVTIGVLVMESKLATTPFWSALALLLAAQAVTSLAERSAVDAEAHVAAALRRKIIERLAAMPARAVQTIPVGEAIIGLQRQVEAVAALTISHKAASVMMGVGPLLAAIALFLVSWQAAALMLLLTPLMIIFFALVGETIRNRAAAQERAFGRLAGQFADRVRTLPTIVANHAVDAEAGKLRRRLEAYAANTMGVLRVAFLNSGIIDFFASLSIAMLAVFLGLGHLGLASIPGFSNLELWQSLFILMIAPDYFAPFRRFAEQYHAKAEGQAAAVALDRLLAAQAPALAALSIPAPTLPERGLVALTGPSGSGKTTMLRQLTGIDDAAGGKAVAWIATDAFTPAGSLAEAIGWNRPPDGPVVDAARRVGLLDDALLPGGLTAAIAVGGENLSGGQRMRLAVARAGLSPGPVFADEPTAKLDAANAASVRALLAEMAQDRLVVVATHDPQLAALAVTEIKLEGAQ